MSQCRYHRTPSGVLWGPGLNGSELFGGSNRGTHIIWGIMLWLTFANLQWLYSLVSDNPDNRIIRHLFPVHNGMIKLHLLKPEDWAEGPSNVIILEVTYVVGSGTYNIQGLRTSNPVSVYISLGRHYFPFHVSHWGQRLCGPDESRPWRMKQRKLKTMWYKNFLNGESSHHISPPPYNKSRRGHE